MPKRNINKLTVNGARKGGFFRSAFRFCVFMGLILTTCVAIACLACYAYLAPVVPKISSISEYQPRIGSTIYSVDNQLIGEFSSERRVLVPYNKIPIKLIQALVAAEDKRFFSHHGMDYIGVINAVTQKIRNPKSKLRGASTLTQQFAKAMLVEEEGFDEGTSRKLSRKIKELILARRMEQSMDKEDILYLYLNQVYLGHHAYGVQAAAQNYFHKNVWELDLAEAATFAGLVQSPSAHSPYRHPKRAKERRYYVLSRMLEEGFITKAEFDQASKEDLVVYPLSDPFLERAPYYTETVRQEVIKMFTNPDLCEATIRDMRDIGYCKARKAQCAEGVKEKKDKCQKAYEASLTTIPEDACEKEVCQKYVKDKCSKWNNEKYCLDYYKNSCDYPERCMKIHYLDRFEKDKLSCIKNIDIQQMLCEEEMGKKSLLEGGLKVYTAMVPAKQNTGDKALHKQLLELDKRQGYRGPLANIPKSEWPEFKKYASQIAPKKAADLVEDQRYLALVTGFDPERKDTFIQVGEIEGIMPLAAMRWARTPNPVIYYSDAYLTNPQQALKVGDVILVTPTTWKKLSANRFAYEILNTVKVRPEKPMFALDQDPIAQGSMMSLDARSGYVESMIGGYDFADSPLNRPMQACRQPGSSFKPVIYTAAVDKLNYTPSTIIIDAPFTGYDALNGNTWKPENSDNTFKGDTPIRTCIKDSMNICAVKTVEHLFDKKRGGLGISEVIDYAKSLGIDTDARPLNRDMSMALGSSCVTMWDLINVYTTLNRGGVRQEKYIIKRVEDRDGKILYDATAAFDPTNTFGEQLNRTYHALKDEPKRIVDKPTAYVMTSLLHDVVKEGTATRVKNNLLDDDRKPIYASGKTGTTNDSFDAWFMGYTKDYVTATWIGHDKNERPLGPREFGGNGPLMMWLDYMKVAIKDIPQPDPEPPVGVVDVLIDPENGLLASPQTPSPVREYYRAGTEPHEVSKRNMDVADTDDIYADDES